MLKFLSGRKRSRNLLLIFFILVLTVSLVGLFSVVVSGGGSGLLGGKGGNDTTIARVGSYDVTLKEYKDALNGFAQQISQGQGHRGMQSLTTTYSIYGTQVLDGLVREKLIQYEADRLSLGATDSEIEARLKQTFNPWPGPEGYKERLIQAGISPVQFEAGLRAGIASEHLKSYVTAAIEVSPQEVEDDYRHGKTTFAFRWAEVNADELKDKVTMNDADLRAYFDSHKDDFKITTEQRRARYLFVDTAKAGESIQVSDDELKAEFDPERNIKAMRVSEIVLNVPKASEKKATDKNAAPAGKDADPEDVVRKKAQDLAERAKGSEGKPAEDFAQLARQNSDDPKGKSSGGDLGWINKDDKRDKDDPLNNVFMMKVGDISQPIKKGDKYYVLKVTDKRSASFEEAKAGLLKDARTQKGYTQGVNIANDAAKRFQETKDPQAVVGEINKKYGAEVASVKEVPFFAKNDSPPELGGAFSLETAIFELANPGDIGESTSISGGFAVPQYLERRDPHDATFEEVKTKVENKYRDDKARQLAQERARQICQAKSPDELKTIAASVGAKVDERAGLSESDSIGSLTVEDDRAPIYKLNTGQVTSEPIKSESGDHYVAVAVVSRKDADMGDAFQKEKKSIEQRLLDEKRNIYFTTYLAQLQQRLKDDGKIKIFRDRIDSAMEALAGEPGAPGGGPAPPASLPQRTRRPTRTPAR